MSEKKSSGVFAIGLSRGLVGFVTGALIGLFFVSSIRLALRLPAWQPASFGFTEPAWVVGAFLLFRFYDRRRVLGMWKWAKGEETEIHPHDAYASGWERYLSVSYDHKVIGVQYGVTSLILFVLAGLFALIFRTELIAPGIQFLSLRNFNTIMSLHGIVMIGAILLVLAPCRITWFPY